MQAEILRIEREFEQAIIANDADALDQMLAGDWIIVDPDGGIIEKGRFLGAIRMGILKHQSMSSEDARVGIHGTTATVTALTKSSGTFMGQPFTSHERATDVFVHENGRWLCVLTQLTRIAKK